jgi:hypothetical protein
LEFSLEKKPLHTIWSTYAQARGSTFGWHMQTVYDSQNYHVIEYAGIDGFEVTNKAAQAFAYFHGEMAAAFRDNLAKVIAEDPSIDSVDEFLGGLDSLMVVPAVLH